MKKEAAASRRAARIEEEHRRAFLASFADALLVKCDHCGLEQVTGGTAEFVQPCIVCGCETGSFAEDLASSGAAEDSLHRGGLQAVSA